MSSPWPDALPLRNDCIPIQRWAFHRLSQGLSTDGVDPNMRAGSTLLAQALKDPDQLSVQGADHWVMNHSVQNGCRLQTALATEWSFDKRSGGQGVAPIVTQTRHWFDPDLLGSTACQRVFSDHRSSGEQPMVMGGVTVSLRRHFAQRLTRRSAPTPLTCHYESALSPALPPGSWLRLMAGLAQDQFLQGLAVFHAQQAPGLANNAPVCPNRDGSQELTVSHGLGLVRLVSGKRTSYLGFDAHPALAFPAIETRLFSQAMAQLAADWIQQPDVQLDAVLPPALVRLVRIMAAASLAGQSISLPQAIVLDRVSAFGASLAIRPDISADRWLQEVSHDLQDAAIQSEHSSDEEILSEQALNFSASGVSRFMALAQGLSRLQDDVRYGTSGICRLPVAGTERAYLNALLRNLMCQALGIVRPAEIAQFDLLLTALRNSRNLGFNDYSHDSCLQSEMCRLSGHAAGSKQPLARHLEKLTQSVISQTEAAESQTGAAVFVLDEWMPEGV